MIALIDYGAGNLTSVRKALTALGAEYATPTSPDELQRFSAVIVPGVGNFAATAALVGPWRDGEWVYPSWFDRTEPRSVLKVLHVTAGDPFAARLELGVRW